MTVQTVGEITKLPSIDKRDNLVRYRHAKVAQCLATVLTLLHVPPDIPLSLPLKLHMLKCRHTSTHRAAKHGRCARPPVKCHSNSICIAACFLLQAIWQQHYLVMLATGDSHLGPHEHSPQSSRGGVGLQTPQHPLCCRHITPLYVKGGFQQSNVC